MGSCATCRRSFDPGIEVCPDDGIALLPDDVVAAATADLAPGTPVGEYVVQQKLGEGAYGAVYAAEHAVIGKRAALKLLNKRYSSDLAIVSRFVTEARAVNRIRHPNIVDIFAFGQHEGQHYLAMELLDGTSLEEHLRRRGRLPIEEALPILRGVAEELDAAHEKGIVHRDLKPDNIFLVRDKSGARVPKLLDFGVAKLQADGESSHKTATGIAIGTPYYVPLHTYLLAQHGVPILELVWLEDLARDRVYEVAFVGGSLKLRGADAAPLRPVAFPLAGGTR